MQLCREGQSQRPAPPNIQDVFLNYARRERLAVDLHLIDGREFEARIKNFDRFALIVEHNGVDHLVFKHAIATIRVAPQRAATTSRPRIIVAPRDAVGVPSR